MGSNPEDGVYPNNHKAIIVRLVVVSEVVVGVLEHALKKRLPKVLLVQYHMVSIMRRKQLLKNEIKKYCSHICKIDNSF